MVDESGDSSRADTDSWRCVTLRMMLRLLVLPLPLAEINHTTPAAVIFTQKRERCGR